MWICNIWYGVVFLFVVKSVQITFNKDIWRKRSDKLKLWLPCGIYLGVMAPLRLIQYFEHQKIVRYMVRLNERTYHKYEYTSLYRVVVRMFPLSTNLLAYWFVFLRTSVSQKWCFVMTLYHIHIGSYSPLRLFLIVKHQKPKVIMFW